MFQPNTSTKSPPWLHHMEGIFWPPFWLLHTISVWRGKCITPFLLLCRKTQQSAIVNYEQIENILQTHGKFFIIFRCASAYGIAVDGKKYATWEGNMPVFDKKFVVKTLVEKLKELPDDLQAEFLAWMERKILAERMSCKT